MDLSGFSLSATALLRFLAGIAATTGKDGLKLSIAMASHLPLARMVVEQK